MILLTQREGTRVSARETVRVPARMRPRSLNKSSERVPEREERRWTQTDRQTERYREKEDAEGRKLGFHTQADKWLRTEAGVHLENRLADLD